MQDIGIDIREVYTNYAVYEPHGYPRNDMLHNYAAYHLTNIGEVIYRIVMQYMNLTNIGEVDMLHNYAAYKPHQNWWGLHILHAVCVIPIFARYYTNWCMHINTNIRVNLHGLCSIDVLPIFVRFTHLLQHINTNIRDMLHNLCKPHGNWYW